jgi:hypothetical protein
VEVVGMGIPPPLLDSFVLVSMSVIYLPPLLPVVNTNRGLLTQRRLDLPSTCKETIFPRSICEKKRVDMSSTTIPFIVYIKLPQK